MIRDQRLVSLIRQVAFEKKKEKLKVKDKKEKKKKKKDSEIYASDIVISYKICTYRLRLRLLQEKKVTKCVGTVP